VDGHPKSSYKEGVEIIARPVTAMANHPVIRGLGPLPVVDEAHLGMWHADGIRVLMETDHPLNDRPVRTQRLHDAPPWLSQAGAERHSVVGGTAPVAGRHEENAVKLSLLV